jgi:hypothetical protein
MCVSRFSWKSRGSPLFARLRTTVKAAVIDRPSHHPANRSDQLAFARYDSGLDGQQLATHLRPRQSGDLTDLVLLFSQAVAELTHAQEVSSMSAVTFTEKRFSSMFFDRLAANLGNLPLQPPHTGFAGVVADDVANRFDFEFQLAFLRPLAVICLGEGI